MSRKNNKRQTDSLQRYRRRTRLLQGAGRLFKKAISKSVNGGMPTYPDRYQIIDEMKNRYPITWLAEMAKNQRSGYYKWLKNGKVSLRKQDDILLKEHILTIFKQIKCMVIHA